MFIPDADFSWSNLSGGSQDGSRGFLQVISNYTYRQCPLLGLLCLIRRKRSSGVGIPS